MPRDHFYGIETHQVRAGDFVQWVVNGRHYDSIVEADEQFNGGLKVEADLNEYKAFKDLPAIADILVCSRKEIR